MFRICIDSREKRPYSFSCPAIGKTLPAGDYSVEGYESRIAVERKSLSDFTHTVIHDFGRFQRELRTLSAYEHACIVIEADLDAVLRGSRSGDLRGGASYSTGI